MVPPEPRLPGAPGLIEHGEFFVIHAPRQTGKNTTLRVICRRLTSEGKYAAVHFRCEAGEPAGGPQRPCRQSFGRPTPGRQRMRDLGLIAASKPVQVANPIYREIIARVMSASTEDSVSIDRRSFVLADGQLDFRRMLEEFASFWREHGEVLTRRDTYHEAAPQLVLMAFLQRVIHGGGYIDREYGVGRGRIDLLVRWPHAGKGGERHWQREAVELKVWGLRSPGAQGLTRIDRRGNGPLPDGRGSTRGSTHGAARSLTVATPREVPRTGQPAP